MMFSLVGMGLYDIITSVFCFSPIMKASLEPPLKIKWVPLHKPLQSTNHEADVAPVPQEVTFQQVMWTQQGLCPSGERERDGWRGR